MAKIIILDTSFLLELFEVPMDSNLDMSQEAINLMTEAIEGGYDIYVPLPVIYELANHIVDVKNSKIRNTLAERLKGTVIQAWNEKNPFTIIPCESSELIISELTNLPAICEKYKASIDQGLSLADCTTIDLAQRLKQRYKERSKPWKTHIWTAHKVLKSMEPDTHLGSLV